MNLGKFKPLDSRKLLDGLYANASAVLGRDWRDNYEQGMDPKIRDFNYVRSYSYIVLMVLGLAGLIKHSKREHLIYFLPVYGYIVLLIFLTQLQGKIDSRILAEPVLVAYVATLLGRGPDAPSR